MADRTEKLSITRTHSATNVKMVIVENGVTVSYSVKTYESAVKQGIELARAGAEKFLWQAKLAESAA